MILEIMPSPFKCEVYSVITKYIVEHFSTDHIFAQICYTCEDIGQ